ALSAAAARPTRRRHPDGPAAGLAAVVLDHRPGDLGQRRLRDGLMADEAFTPAAPFGAPVPRREDPRLITGRGRYVSDVELPRLLHVAFVRSTHAHARLRDVDTRAAARSPGATAIVTGR